MSRLWVRARNQRNKGANIKHISITEDPRSQPTAGTIHDSNPLLGVSGFAYPDAIEELIEDAEIRVLLDEFVRAQMFRAMAEAFNRILTEIIEAENPRKSAIIIAWSIGLRLDKLDSEPLVLAAAGISRSTLFEAKRRVLKMLKQ